MNMVNNYNMKKLKMSKNIRGKFYLSKRILRFKNPSDIITDKDIMNLFMGFINLLQSMAEQRLEQKYSSEILRLQREINYLRQIKNVN